MKLNRDFYLNPNVVEVAQSLIGLVLVSKINNKYVSARIVETEAYRGFDDLACHAAKGKTPRNAPMFETGGIAYTYLCYGIHTLFNVVTNKNGIGEAVLVRAAEPLEGIETVLRRRNKKQLKPDVLNGPGKLTKALGITLDNNRTDLIESEELFIENDGFNPQHIAASHRVGVDYAGQDALKNFRFRLANNPFAGPDYVANPKMGAKGSGSDRNKNT